MSLHLEFEPHSWYKGWAIRKNLDGDCKPKFTSRDSDGTRWFTCEAHKETILNPQAPCNAWEPKWSAYKDDGMTYQVQIVEANTLASLKDQINQANQRHRDKWAGIYARLAKSHQEFSTGL